MGTIEIGARYLGSVVPGLGQYYHLYIKITNSAGEVSYIHAFPNGDGEVGLADLPVAGSGSSPQQTGQLEGEYSGPSEVHLDIDDGTHFTSGPIYSGSDAQMQQIVNSMIADMQQINNRGTPYNPLLQNSNSFVHQIVEDVGLDFKMPVNPNGGSPWAPGTYQHLPELPPTGNYYTDLIADYLKHHLYEPIVDIVDRLETFIDHLIDAGRTIINALDDLSNDLRDFLRDFLSDPIVLDLDGNGLDLTALSSSVTKFDLDEDGVAERTGWVGSHDGLLVYDKNGNGRVDGIAELVGSAKTDGFDALASFDSDGNGRIDAGDMAFSALRVWRDVNGNGVTNAGEMLTMAGAGISSLNLTYSELDRDIAGNTLARLGSYTRLDGSSRDMGSVWFALDQRTNVPEMPRHTNIDALLPLPNLSGSASVPDLRTAMSLDPELMAMVKTIVTGDFDFSTLRAFTTEAFEPLLYRWLDVPETPLPGEENKPRYIYALEAVTGQSIPFDDLNSHQQERLGEVEERWANTVDALAIRFLVQSAENPILQSYVDARAAISGLDSESASFEEQIDLILRQLDNDLSSAPAAPGLASSFGQLSIDPVSGALSGDFDSFAKEILKDQPSFFSSSFSIGGGSGGVVSVFSAGEGYRHPWTAWYEDQGSLLFDVAAAMGIGPDYVMNATGWRWLFGAATDHYGTSGSDILDYTVTYYQELTFGQVLSPPVPTHDQRLFGYGGVDELRGNDGVDRLVGGAGNDLLKGGSDSDMYIYATGDGLDRIVEESGSDDAIYFSSEFVASNLRVTRMAGTDDLLLNFGNLNRGIILTGQWTSSSLAVEQFHFVAQDGLDAGDIASRYLATLATAGADVITGSWAGETLIGEAGNDSLYGVDGDDLVQGGSGNDLVDGGNGSDTVMGDAADDTVIGGSGNDRLIGGTGNDLLIGGSENDTYVFNRGDGQDIIRDYDSFNYPGIDTVELGVGIAPSDVTVIQTDNGNDIVLSIIGTTDKITLDDTINSGTRRIEFVTFADGTVWTAAQLLAEAIKPTGRNDIFYGSYDGEVLRGGNGDDTLDARGGDDTLIGGRGNDILIGNSESDTYVFNRGDGQDIIRDYDSFNYPGIDTVQLGAGIAPSDVTVSQTDNGNDIVLSIIGTTDTVTLDNTITSGTRRIEQVTFADGTVWTAAQLLATAIKPTGGNDVFYGSYDGEVLRGGNGDDTLDARGGDDTLIGGRGNDILIGNSESDTYVFNRGDGQDIIRDYDSFNYPGIDTVQLGAGIAPSDVTVSQTDNGNDIVLSIIGTTDTVTLDNTITSGTRRIEQVTFANGTVWTHETLISLSGASSAGFGGDGGIHEADIYASRIDGHMSPYYLNNCVYNNLFLIVSGATELV